MSICLGNLTVDQIERRLGIKLSNTEKDELLATRQEAASDIAPGKWHCFDLPFMIMCGDFDFAAHIRDLLTPYAHNMLCSIQIGVEKNKKTPEGA